MGIVGESGFDSMAPPGSFAKYFCGFHGWLAFRYVFRIGWVLIDLSVLVAIVYARMPWAWFGIFGLAFVVLDQVVRDRFVSEVLQLMWLRFCNGELLTKHCVSCKTHPPPINPLGGGPDGHSH